MSGVAMAGASRSVRASGVRSAAAAAIRNEQLSARVRILVAPMGIRAARIPVKRSSGVELAREFANRS
jgi:hypothetical protein